MPGLIARTKSKQVSPSAQTCRAGAQRVIQDFQHLVATGCRHCVHNRHHHFLIHSSRDEGRGQQHAGQQCCTTPTSETQICPFLIVVRWQPHYPFLWAAVLRDRLVDVTLQLSLFILVLSLCQIFRSLMIMWMWLENQRESGAAKCGYVAVGGAGIPGGLGFWASCCSDQQQIYTTGNVSLLTLFD